jgi:hypothetical protein
MHKHALSLILPVFLAVAFGFTVSGCDKKEEKKDDKKADKKDDKKEEKADGGW